MSVTILDICIDIWYGILSVPMLYSFWVLEGKCDTVKIITLILINEIYIYSNFW